MNDYYAAELNYKEANYMIPGRILPEYLLTKLYYETRRNNKADSIADRISYTKIKIISDSTHRLLKEINIMHKKNKEYNRLDIPDRGK